jgi:hypothetical protein
MVETVYFGDRRQTPVRLLRGVPRRIPTIIQPQRIEVLSFGSGFADRVTVVRGGTSIPRTIGRKSAAEPSRIETVSFVDPRIAPVTIVRGTALQKLFSVDLFAPANGGELDRIAFAVDGVESRHGADPGMWRPSWTGPQGPMQVSAAAALDVGGGDRFDLRQNRLLGRAYLAQMFQRYGNWPDAIAAYNWGPGSMDLWITGGRHAERLPFDVVRYVDRVLRDALITMR